MLVLEKAYSLFELIFKVYNSFAKTPKHDIFQKTVFCTLVSSMNLGLNAVSRCLMVKFDKIRVQAETLK